MTLCPVQDNFDIVILSMFPSYCVHYFAAVHFFENCDGPIKKLKKCMLKRNKIYIFRWVLHMGLILKSFSLRLKTEVLNHWQSEYLCTQTTELLNYRHTLYFRVFLCCFRVAIPASKIPLQSLSCSFMA